MKNTKLFKILTIIFLLIQSNVFVEAGIEALQGEAKIYEEKVSDDLFFVIEKVVLKTQPFWRKFKSNGEKRLEQIDSAKERKAREEKEERISQSTYDALFHFGAMSMRKYAWIAYASNTSRLSHQLDRDFMNHIEMSFVVTIEPNTPLTNHMGISRNPMYQGASHKNLALRLHGFAARMSKSIDDSKIYMATCPLPKMRSILEAALHSNPFQSVKDGDIVTFQEGKIIFSDSRIAPIKIPNWDAFNPYNLFIVSLEILSQK